MTTAKVIIDGNQYQRATYVEQPDVKHVVAVLQEVFNTTITYVRYVQGTTNAVETGFHRFLRSALPGIMEVKLYKKKKQSGNLADGTGTATIEVEEGVDSDMVASIMENSGHDMVILISGDADILPGIEKIPPGASLFVCAARKAVSGRLMRYVKPKPGKLGEGFFLEEIIQMAKEREPATVCKWGTDCRNKDGTCRNIHPDSNEGIPCPYQPCHDPSKCSFDGPHDQSRQASHQVPHQTARDKQSRDQNGFPSQSQGGGASNKHLPQDFLKNVSSPTDLKARGYTVSQLKKRISLSTLKEAGYTVEEFTETGYNIVQLAKAGFDAQAFKDAGYTAGSFKLVGLDVDTCLRIGFSAQELRSVGFIIDVSRLHTSNGWWTALRLKSAGFTLQELCSITNYGFGKFDCGELYRAGFTIQELHTEFNLREYRLVGIGYQNNVKSIMARYNFTPEELRSMGEFILP